MRYITNIMSSNKTLHKRKFKLADMFHEEALPKHLLFKYYTHARTWTKGRLNMYAYFELQIVDVKLHHDFAVF